MYHPSPFRIAEESVGGRAITSVAFNTTGDLVALGCADLGQLLVWEWQSQQQALKQQGHFHKMACLSYSPNGHSLATGGDDGKVSPFITHGNCLQICFFFLFFYNWNWMSFFRGKSFLYYDLWKKISIFEKCPQTFFFRGFSCGQCLCQMYALQLYFALVSFGQCLCQMYALQLYFALELVLGSVCARCMPFSYTLHWS